MLHPVTLLLQTTVAHFSESDIIQSLEGGGKSLNFIIFCLSSAMWLQHTGYFWVIRQLDMVITYSSIDLPASQDL